MSKLKTYLGSSVWLRNVPPEHVSSNGCRQFTVLIRAKTKKEAGEIIGYSVAQLNRIGFDQRDENSSLGYVGKAQKIGDIVKKDKTVYYLVEHTKNGYVGEWFELVNIKNIS